MAQARRRVNQDHRGAPFTYARFIADVLAGRVQARRLHDVTQESGATVDVIVAKELEGATVDVLIRHPTRQLVSIEYEEATPRGEGQGQSGNQPRNKERV